jgi:hypothetical protein
MYAVQKGLQGGRREAREFPSQGPENNLLQTNDQTYAFEKEGQKRRF